MSLFAKIVLSVPVLAAYVFGVGYFRQRRAWLGYYLFASLGLVLIIVFGAQTFGLSNKIEYFVTYVTATVSSWVGIKAQFLGQNEIMVADRNGWVTLQTTIECSALIESAVLIGLILFYPTFTLARKMKLIGIGLIITGVANIMRLLIITSMTAHFGRQAVFLGHAIVGRLFFLAVMITMYWYILTMPTIRDVANNIASAEAK